MFDIVKEYENTKNVEKMIAKMFWKTKLTKHLIRLQQKYGKYPIIMYHSVDNQNNHNNNINSQWESDLVVTPASFERQISKLTKDFKCVSCTELLKSIHFTDNKKPLLAISFDDGYKNNLLNAVPILKKYGAGATFFLIGCHLDKKYPSPKHLMFILKDKSVKKYLSLMSSLEKEIKNEREYELILNEHKINSISWEDQFIMEEDAEILLKNGFEVGSHGYNHLMVFNNENKYFELEIKKSFEKIKQLTNSNNIGYAFPFGRPKKLEFSTDKILRENKYFYALTNYEGLNDRKSNLYALKRVNIEETLDYVTYFRLTGIRSPLKNYRLNKSLVKRQLLTK